MPPRYQKRWSLAFGRDGSFINIWEDNWLPQQIGHKVWSPKPSDSSICWVRQLINDDLWSWNMALINSTFLPFEVGTNSSNPPLEFWA